MFMVMSDSDYSTFDTDTMISNYVALKTKKMRSIERYCEVLISFVQQIILRMILSMNL